MVKLKLRWQAMTLTSSMILYISALIEERLGIAVQTQLRGALEEALGKTKNGGELILALEGNRETSTVWQKLIEELTIGETYFLRDATHFRLLRTEILPEIIEHRRAEDKLTLNIWSVGCATGEEPYSVAITLTEMLSDLGRWTIRLIGTDINNTALHIARRGVYRKWAFRHTDLDFQTHYFDPAPNGLQIKSNIRQMVSFQHTNLFTPTARPEFDVILCRNVLLYFSDKHTKQAETLFYNSLVPGGWLLLGQSETLRDEHYRWGGHTPFPGQPIYRKPLDLSDIRRRSPVSRAEQLATTEVNAVAVDLYEEAVMALQQENYNDAETMINDLLAIKPQHAPAHVLLASIMANQQQRAEAHQQIDIALDQDPLLADGYYLRALLFMEDSEMMAAQNALTSALYCQRNHPLASYLLGNIYARSGDIPRATRHWTITGKAIKSLTADSPVSDVSHITAGRLQALVDEQLKHWVR
jgi:chemotaxis protein methyltransferase CheR